LIHATCFCTRLALLSSATRIEELIDTRGLPSVDRIATEEELRERTGYGRATVDVRPDRGGALVVAGAEPLVRLRRTLLTVPQGATRSRTPSPSGRAGKIILTASPMSSQGGIDIPGYTAAKSGVAGLTRALSNEWAGRGVQVNAIAPGYITTDNTEALRADPARHAAILDRIPAGRWGTADDIAGATVFLASAASDYVSGAVLPVDGGWLGR
jgi:NAD(P)-dependent dehydrogenase (short-subunit alcohol dehydrogenase family)